MKRFLDRVRQYLASPILAALEDRERRLSYSTGSGQAETQKLLILHYKDHVARGLPPLSLREQGFQIFSQNDDDGILLHIFALIGCNRYGYNAFFVRNDLGQAYLPEVAAHSCFGHPLNRVGMAERWPKVKDMEWIAV